MNNTYNGLRDYFVAISKYPLLSQNEETELGYRIKQGDGNAREQLINCNLKLVVTIAKKYKTAKLSLEDLIAFGNVGLITAVDKYDPSLNYRFSTCAVPWIKQAILKGIADTCKTVRLPAHIWQQLNQMKKLENELGADGHEVSDEELATAMKIEPAKVARLRSWKQTEISLETPLGDDTNDTLTDLQPDDSPTPKDIADRKFEHDYIMKKIAELPDRTQIIMKMRYGLGTDKDPQEWGEEHTLEEIGAYLGITRERVRQIEKQALNDLRNGWEQ